MAQVRLGIVVGQAENDQQRPVELVGLLNGVLQGIVIQSPLGLLHPVEDVGAVVGYLQVIQDLNSLLFDDLRRHI